MKIPLLLSLLFSTVLFQNCTKETEITLLEGDVIKSGQNFGFCIGNCFQEISISLATGEVVFEVRNNDTGDGNFRSTFFYDKISQKEKEAIKDAFSLQQLKKLDPIIGCPDCADGGSEWVESNINGKSCKVTFEYGREIEGINNLVTLLRNHRNILSNKYLPQN